MIVRAVTTLLVSNNILCLFIMLWIGFERRLYKIESDTLNVIDNDLVALFTVLSFVGILLSVFSVVVAFFIGFHRSRGVLKKIGRASFLVALFQIVYFGVRFVHFIGISGAT
mgnify:CR=1 FL=1